MECFGFLHFFRLDDYVHVLEKEVNIDYCRSMNKIIFDKTVTNDSETFAFVQLPEPEPEQVPERGKNEFSAVIVTYIMTLTLSHGSSQYYKISVAWY